MSTTPPPAASPRVRRAALLLIGIAVVLLSVGSFIGLFRAPPDRFMGDVARILYVHVPTAWNALLAFTFAFVCALGFLFTARWRWDQLLEGALEVGVLLAALLCTQGAIWAKPTWGIWWAWDPRLTTTAVMLVSFIGILTLRRVVDDPTRRAVWASVATIVAYVNVPIVYMSVKWWNSLHQLQSSPKTVDAAMVLPLRINAFGVLALGVAYLLLRAELARGRHAEELVALPPRELPAARA